jgi:sugar lactone lactonase YvrE
MPTQTALLVALLFLAACSGTRSDEISLRRDSGPRSMESPDGSARLDAGPLTQSEEGASPAPSDASVAMLPLDTGLLEDAPLPSDAAALPDAGGDAEPTAPGLLTLSPLPIVGLRPQAELTLLRAIDHEASGSFVFSMNSVIKRLSADLSSITVVAGALTPGSSDGPADSARFSSPLGLAHDASGNIYVADTGNFTIRRIAPDGTVSTLAGTAGASGTDDGTGANARFSRVTAIAMGPDGDLYVADTGNSRVRRVTMAGVVTTYAGSIPALDDGPVSMAHFLGPNAIAVAANSDVLVADGAYIRRIVRSGNAAVSVETLAGNTMNDAASPDGIGRAAVISPVAMVVRDNTLTFTNAYGLLRQLDLTNAAVTTLAGSRALGAGFADGSGSAARIMALGGGIALAPDGGFMLSDDRSLRHVSATGLLRTLASGFAQGMSPTGVGTLAQMPFASVASSGGLQAVAADPAGHVVVFEKQTRVVRRISPAGVVTLVAGLIAPTPAGALDGVGSAAQFNSTFAAIASDSTGVLYVGDSFGVRRIGLDSATTLLAGSRSEAGALDGPAGSARFTGIRGVTVQPGGDVFVADSNAVRRVDAAGNVSTYAGVMGQSASLDGPIASARFTTPGPMAFAPDGSLFVVDSTGADGIVRKISSDGTRVTTLPIAPNSSVTALAVDAAGTLYYAGYSGLMMLPVGGTPTILIPLGAYVAFGANPTVGLVDSIAVTAPKQLCVLSTGQLLRVTLP